MNKLWEPTFLSFNKSWYLAFSFMLFGFFQPLLAQDVNPCSSIQVIGTTEDASVFQGIIVSNSVTDKQVVRIFNENWEQISACESDECGNPYTFATGAGKYYVQVLLFNEDGTWLCQADPIDVIVPDGNNPCVSFCQQPLIEFNSQADIDDFCGCEVIKGDVRITGDVNSLRPLNELKKIEGFLAIFESELSDFSGLENLEFIGTDIYVGNNPNLKNLKGLENVPQLGGVLAIESNPILESLEGINLHSFRSLNISGNEVLSDISTLRNITELGSLSITANTSLPNLEGLNQLKTLGDGNTQGGGFSSLVIGGNAGIKNLDALSNLLLVTENIIVEFNNSLSECCGIAHLIDEDPNNGLAQSGVSIKNNPIGCNSVAEVLADCQGVTPSCDDISVKGDNGKITINNLSAPIEIVKIYNSNWEKVFECVADCADPTVYETSAGKYYVQVQLYTENWRWICQTDNLEVMVKDDGVNCDDIVTTISDLIIENGQARREVSITFNTPEGQRTGINLFDRNQDPNNGGLLIDCGICESPQNFTLKEGEYALIIDRSYLDISISPLGCSDFFFIDVPAEPCIDNDGDYVCEYNECNDNDPEVIDLKFPAGTPCDDRDDNTRDDVIQADGCTCAGIPISDDPCENVQVSLNENNPQIIDVVGLTTGNHIVKVYDPRWNVVRDCSGECNFLGVFREPGTYRVYAQLYDERWQYICETDFIEVEIPDLQNDSRNGGDFINEQEIVLFPNPVLSTLNIKTGALKDKKGSIQIFNPYGQLIEEFPNKVFNQAYEAIEVRNYENGLYLMTIKVENSRIISKRFLVEHLK